jgi:integrase
MPVIRLTDAACQRLKAPSGARVDYFDAGFPGLAFRVSGPTPKHPEGRKTWTLFYRLSPGRGGEQKRQTLDPSYPALGLAAARKKAGELLAMLAEGKDPAAETAKVREEVARAPDTVASVVELFIARQLEARNRAPRYIEETRRNFNLHVLPKWKKRDIASITRREVIELLDAVVDAEDGRGGPVAANRTLAAVRALFNFAVLRDIIAANPVSGIARPAEESSRERALSADELRELWPHFAALGYPFGPFFQIVLLTGQRRSEVAGMRWDAIDLKAKTWTLASDETKGRRWHVVPLSDLVISILLSLPRKAASGTNKPNPYVFTTQGDTPISGFSVAKRRIDERIAKARKEARADTIAPWGIHDLRRTAATEMGRLGVSEFIIGRVLNHAAKGVTGKVYNRYEYLNEKRRALDLWGRYLDTLTKPPAANVVALREAAG